MLLSALLSDSWELKHATRNISPSNNQANIVDLHPASVYSIRMYSYNAIGKSEASKEVTISTEEARKFLGTTAYYKCTLKYPFKVALPYISGSREHERRRTDVDSKYLNICISLRRA